MRLTDTSPRRTFLDSGRKARFEFELAGTERRDLIVKAIRVADGKVKRRWRLDDVEPKKSQRITWNGKTSKGSYTSQGKHTFKVFERGGGKTDMRKAEGRKRFRFYKHRFPLAARHDFGDGFGAGRGHQGIDIFAKCGKKIRAARGGRVQVRASHSSAGKYLVIDGHGTGQDYAYMHMRGAGRPAEGSRVRTGEVIGRNSDTGNASGCHLHFEIWSSPGWYEGGRAIRPDKRVRRWDGWS
jgi:murein DD-endopeptidase MepM/ murein hydrolase activator NlpD